MKRSKPEHPNKLADQLRRAVADYLADGGTAYALGRDSATDPGLIARFLAGERDVQLATASRLCDALGLKLGAAIKAPSRKPARPRPTA